MLVLSRKQDEKIVLRVENGQIEGQPAGEDIEITVVRIDANKVRLGIKASPKTTILRSELLEKQATA